VFENSKNHKMTLQRLLVQKLGTMQYQPAWEIQKLFAAKIKANVDAGRDPEHRLLLVEHYPVYTVGIRSKEYTLQEEEHLKSLGAEFHRTNRGGLITFHGPGQLTAYPILHLKSFGKGIKWYVCALERTIIRTCHSFGVAAQTSPHTGVWVGDNKICALGIQGRHVTTHGLALNCNTDLSWYNHIVPCGIPDKGVTSLSKELCLDVTIQDVIPHFLKAFQDVFQCHAIEIEPENNCVLEKKI